MLLKLRATGLPLLGNARGPMQHPVATGTGRLGSDSDSDPGRRESPPTQAAELTE
jgi:hypothetical protein